MWEAEKFRHLGPAWHGDAAHRALAVFVFENPAAPPSPDKGSKTRSSATNNTGITAACRVQPMSNLCRADDG